MFRLTGIAFLIGSIAAAAMAQTPAPAATPAPPAGGRAARPPAPTRDPHTPGYVTATELPDGTNASIKADGNFIIGATHPAAPEMAAQENVPEGTIYSTVRCNQQSAPMTSTAAASFRGARNIP